MTAKELKDKYENDLKELQDKCTHEKTTQMEYHWAPGHSSGRLVEVCDYCWKNLGEKGFIKMPLPNENIIFPKPEVKKSDDEPRFC